MRHPFPRRLCFLALVVLSTISLQGVLYYMYYRPSPNHATVTVSPVVAIDPVETFLSYQAYGGYFKQQEAFTKALRIAFVTNRTLIVPPLRLGQPLLWEPFSTLARRQADAQCGDDCGMEEWVEVPWSTLFDIETVQTLCGVRVVENTKGNGPVSFDSAEKVVFDTTTFASKHTQRPSPNAWYRLWFPGSAAPKQDSPVEPRSGSLTEEQLQAFSAQLLQFGSLVPKWRYQTPTADSNDCLQQHAFVRPTRLTAMNSTTRNVQHAMGGAGAFHLLNIDLAARVALEMKGPAALDLKQVTTREFTLEDLSVRARKDMMEALLREVLDELLIHVAASAMMPLRPSALRDLVAEENTRRDSRARLAACLDYHHSVDQHYPVVFFVPRLMSPSALPPDILTAIFDVLPCTFTMEDLHQLNQVDRTWMSDRHTLGHTQMAWETLLMPILETMIGAQANSVIEIPPSRLAFFVEHQAPL